MSSRRNGRVRAIPIIQKLMTSICIYLPVAALVQAAEYLPLIPARSQEHLIRYHLTFLPRVISTLVAERGGSPVLPSTPLRVAGRPCLHSLLLPFASGLPTRGEPRRWHRAPAGELRRPTARSSRPSAESGAAPAAASTRSSRSRPSHSRGAAPALQLGPTLGAEDRHPEGKQREDPPCGKAKVGNPFPPNGG